MGKVILPPLIRSFQETDLDSPFSCPTLREARPGGGAGSHRRHQRQQSRHSPGGAVSPVGIRGTGPFAAAPRFQSGLTSPDPKERQLCAHGWAGSVKRRAVAKPALLRATGDPDADVRASALFALTEIGLPESEAHGRVSQSRSRSGPEGA